MTETPPLSLSVLDGIEGLTENRRAWDECVAATDADIYFTTDWIEVWWQHFGKQRYLLPLCIWQDETLVGALAFFVESIWLGPVPVRIARLAGMDPNYPVLALPLLSGHEEAALNLAFAEVVRRTRCDAISLSPISDLAAALPAIGSASRSLGLRIVADHTDRKHTVMRLPESFDTYLASLSKSRRREYRKDLSRLEERNSLENRVSTPANVSERLRAFVALHTAQWEAVDKAGHFGDWPGSAAFYADVTARLAATGRAAIQEHCANSVPLSTQLSFQQGDRAYWRLIARTLEPDKLSYGVGRVGLVERVRGLIESGIRLVEAAAGEYDYKLNYGGELVPMRRIILGAPGHSSRLRLALLLGWADLLDLVYYRVWFLKLAPRLRRLTGGRPRPLWRSWIRTRL